MANRLNVANIGYDDNNDALTIASDGTISAGTLGSGVVFPAGGTGNPISVAVIADEQAYNVNGGSAAAGWQDRNLNTEISDPDGIVSISSNQFTLGAGTYLITWSVPAYQVDRNFSALYDVTGGNVLLGVSTSEFSSATLVSSTGAYIHTITSSNTYKISQYAQTAFATYGKGVGHNVSGYNNIYTMVCIYKLK